MVIDKTNNICEKFISLIRERFFQLFGFSIDILLFYFRLLNSNETIIYNLMSDNPNEVEKVEIMTHRLEKAFLSKCVRKFLQMV